jgi:hypothetical protein
MLGVWCFPISLFILQKRCKPGFAWILVSLLCTNNYSFFSYNPFLVQQIKMGCNEVVVLHPQKVSEFF